MSATTNETRWHHYLAWFWGAAFLTNLIPHFVAGVSGSPFQSPFASPSGVGLSSAITNVLWGFANLVIGYLLLLRVGHFDPRRTRHVIAPLVAVLATALFLAHRLGPLHGG